MFARAADSTVIARPDADDHRSFVAKGGGFCCRSWHVHFVHRRFISGSSNSIALDYQHCSPWRAISAATHVDPRFISPFVMERLKTLRTTEQLRQLRQQSAVLVEAWTIMEKQERQQVRLRPLHAMSQHYSYTQVARRAGDRAAAASSLQLQLSFASLRECQSQLCRRSCNCNRPCMQC